MIYREEFDPKVRASRIVALAGHPDWECLKEELLVMAYNKMLGLASINTIDPAQVGREQAGIQVLTYLAERLTTDLRTILQQEPTDGKEEEEK